LALTLRSGGREESRGCRIHSPRGSVGIPSDRGIFVFRVRRDRAGRGNRRVKWHPRAHFVADSIVGIERIVEEEVPVAKAIGSGLVTMILTVGIELAILGAFGFRKKSSFFKVGMANAITQTAFTFGMMYSTLYSDRLWSYILLLFFGEFLIFGAEMTYYAFALTEQPQPGKRILYGLIANLASLAISVFALILMSRIFPV